MADNDSSTLTTRPAPEPYPTQPVHSEPPVAQPVESQPHYSSAVPAGPVEVGEGAGAGNPPRTARSFNDRLRQPIVAAVAGGVLLLGIGFGTGYVVGHGRGENASGTTGGQFQGGPGGQGGFGGQNGTGGQGSFGQGGPGTSNGQTGQLPGQSGTGTQSGTGASGSTGTTT